MSTTSDSRIDPPSPADSAADAAYEKKQSPLSAFAFGKISGVYLWGAIILLFGLWIPNTFLTSQNLTNVASSQAVTAILTIGLLFPLAAGVYDLSVGQMLGFADILCAYLIHHGFATGPAIGITLGAGVVVGVVNGVLVAGIGLNSFIATLGTQSILLALVEALSGDQQIVGMPQSLQNLAINHVLGIPITVIYMLVIAVVGWYALEHSPFGRYLYAIGGAPDAARLAGVPNRRLIYGALIVSAVLASFGGILVTANINAGDPTAGPSYLLPAFAAAFLGATQFKSGRFNVPGALLAVFLLATGVTGLELVGAQSWITDLFNGVVLILALTLAKTQGKLRLPSRRSNTMTSPPQASSLASGVEGSVQGNAEP